MRPLFLAVGVMWLSACGSDSYTPPRTYDSQRKDFSFHAVAGTDWDSIGVLGPYETCATHRWACGYDNLGDREAVLVVWSGGDAETIRLPLSAVAVGPDVPAVLRPTQRLCYLDGPEPQVMLYAC